MHTKVSSCLSLETLYANYRELKTGNYIVNSTVLLIKVLLANTAVTTFHIIVSLSVINYIIATHVTLNKSDASESIT